MTARVRIHRRKATFPICERSFERLCRLVQDAVGDERITRAQAGDISEHIDRWVVFRLDPASEAPVILVQPTFDLLVALDAPEADAR
jgi:hypothetical protein